MHQPPSPTESSSQVDSSLRKRVCKACDRCRLKKSKVGLSGDVVITQADAFSVTDQARAVGVEQIMQSACLERGKNHTIRSIQRGMYLFNASPTLRLLTCP